MSDYKKGLEEGKKFMYEKFRGFRNKSIKMEDSDFNRGYEMGYVNGCLDEDMPWWELNEEEHRGYILGFQNGWDNTFGGHHE